MFKHDILLIDLEFSGLDTSKHEILQIAALLLDKKTLKEKRSFMTYVKPMNWKNRNPDAIKVCGITWEQVKDAPSLKKALELLLKKFPGKVTFAKYGGSSDEAFLQAAFKKTRLPYPFDYHHFDLWPLVYVYAAKHDMLHNKKKFHGFSLEDMMDHFGISGHESRHDALTDCRVEAEVFRNILENR